MVSIRKKVACAVASFLGVLALCGVVGTASASQAWIQETLDAGMRVETVISADRIDDFAGVKAETKTDITVARQGSAVAIQAAVDGEEVFSISTMGDGVTEPLYIWGPQIGGVYGFNPGDLAIISENILQGAIQAGLISQADIDAALAMLNGSADPAAALPIDVNALMETVMSAANSVQTVSADEFGEGVLFARDLLLGEGGGEDFEFTQCTYAVIYLDELASGLSTALASVVPAEYFEAVAGQVELYLFNNDDYSVIGVVYGINLQDPNAGNMIVISDCLGLIDGNAGVYTGEVLLSQGDQFVNPLNYMLITDGNGFVILGELAVSEEAIYSFGASLKTEVTETSIQTAFYVTAQQGDESLFVINYESACAFDGASYAGEEVFTINYKGEDSFIVTTSTVTTEPLAFLPNLSSAVFLADLTADDWAQLITMMSQLVTSFQSSGIDLADLGLEGLDLADYDFAA